MTASLNLKFASRLDIRADSSFWSLLRYALLVRLVIGSSPKRRYCVTACLGVQMVSAKLNRRRPFR
jgi:hypothetical protein